MCKPAVIAQDLKLGADVSDLALDKKRIYWATTKGVFAIAKTGGAVSTLAAVELVNLSSIAVDSTYVYWVSGSIRGLQKVPLDGGAVTAVGSGLAVVDVASDGSNTYLTSRSPTGSVMRVPPDAAPVALVEQSDASASSAGIAVGRDRIYWVSTKPMSYAPVALVFTTPSGGAGVVVKTLDPGDRVEAIAATGLNVFWNAGTSGQDLWAQALPNQPAMIARSGPIVDIAATDSEVFWTDGNGVYKAAAVGGPAIPLASAQTLSAGIAVDETSVYWLNRGSNTLVKVPR